METLISLCVDNKKRLSSVCLKKNMKAESGFLLVFRFIATCSVLGKPIGGPGPLVSVGNFRFCSSHAGMCFYMQSLTWVCWFAWDQKD